MGLFRKRSDDRSGEAKAIAQVVKAKPLKEHKDRTTWRFVTLVRPEEGEPFGAMFEEELPHSVGLPVEWHQMPVLYDPQRRMQGRLSVDLAALGSVDLTKKIPTEIRIGGQVVTPGPRWIVPHECPNCGAIVDQAKQEMEAEPKCKFCQQPLPVEAGSASTGITGFPASHGGPEGTAPAG
jgi:predicted RNA-binding Zn-ribbon protein involved in translation (DUF1610 family)